MACLITVILRARPKRCRRKQPKDFLWKIRDIKISTKKKWQQLSKEEQILNIAAEFSRVKNWLAKNDEQEIYNCLKRAFELIDLTINDQKWQRALKELLRFREVLAGFYLAKNKDKDEFIKIFKTLLNFNKTTISLLRIK